MKKESLKLLEVLFNAGFTTESEIQKIGLQEIIELGKLSFAQLVLLDQLQKAIKSGKLLSWLAGRWPEVQQKQEHSANKEAEEM